MTHEWNLTEEEVDGQTLALYRNGVGDELEVRDTYDNPVQLSTPREDRYEVIYDPNVDRVEWRPIYEERKESFARARDAFDYAVETLAGEEISEDMVPDEWETILE